MRDGLRTLLTKEFSQPTDISTAEFLRMTREVLGGKDGLPLTIPSAGRGADLRPEQSGAHP